jgi:beta-glucosidase
MAGTLTRNFNDAFPVALAKGKLNFAFRSARIPEAAGTQDFIGVNYYTVDLVRFAPLAFSSLFHKRSFPQDVEISSTGFFANVPQGMMEALKWAKHFKKPIIILENGVEDAETLLRPRYMIEHIHQIWRAVNENYPIKGYFYWTLVDNFEWERGWTQRFGLWNLNTETQARIRRPSADLYEAICRENGISSAMVEKFAPQIFDEMFPV